MSKRARGEAYWTPARRAFNGRRNEVLRQLYERRLEEALQRESKNAQTPWRTDEHGNLSRQVGDVP